MFLFTRYLITVIRIALITSACSVPLFASSQIILYETTNVIEINIENKEVCTPTVCSPLNGWNGGRAILGIQNANGTVAFAAPGRNNTVWNASNESWRFTPNGASNVSVS